MESQSNISVSNVFETQVCVSPRLRRQREEDKDNDLYEKSFSSKFPGPDEETLLTNIRVFIERVEGSVSTVSENAL